MRPNAIAKNIRLLCAISAMVFGWFAFGDSASVALTRQQTLNFERDIRPLLHARCSECHGAQKQMAGLRFDRKDSAMKVIAPGKSRESELIRRVSSADKTDMMPPTGERLSPREMRRNELTKEKAAQIASYALPKITRHFNEHRFAPVAARYLKFKMLALADSFTIPPAGLWQVEFDEWLARLEPNERELVLLRFVEGLTYEELAAALGVPLGTVESRLFSVRKKLLRIVEAKPNERQRQLKS